MAVKREQGLLDNCVCDGTVLHSGAPLPLRPAKGGADRSRPAQRPIFAPAAGPSAKINGNCVHMCGDHVPPDAWRVDAESGLSSRNSREYSQVWHRVWVDPHALNLAPCGMHGRAACTQRCFIHPYMTG